MANPVNSGYTFDAPPTAAEIEKFEYFSYDYVEKNPGYDDLTYKSFVGIYYNANGVLSGIYVANSSTEQYG